MIKLKGLPKIDRPREKFSQKGTQNFKDEELLAILL
jgi:DNA repair protein RadC